MMLHSRTCPGVCLRFNLYYLWVLDILGQRLSAIFTPSEMLNMSINSQNSHGGMKGIQNIRLELP